MEYEYSVIYHNYNESSQVSYFRNSLRPYLVTYQEQNKSFYHGHAKSAGLNTWLAVNHIVQEHNEKDHLLQLKFVCENK